MSFGRCLVIICDPPLVCRYGNTALLGSNVRCHRGFVSNGRGQFRMREVGFDHKAVEGASLCLAAAMPRVIFWIRLPLFLALIVHLISSRTYLVTLTSSRTERDSGCNFMACPPYCSGHTSSVWFGCVLRCTQIGSSLQLCGHRTNRETWSTDFLLCAKIERTSFGPKALGSSFGWTCVALAGPSVKPSSSTVLGRSCRNSASPILFAKRTCLLPAKASWMMSGC